MFVCDFISLPLVTGNIIHYPEFGKSVIYPWGLFVNKIYLRLERGWAMIFRNLHSDAISHSCLHFSGGMAKLPLEF